MGRIRTALVKRVAGNLLEQYSDLFKPNFEENKRLVMELTDVSSKRLRNIIVGYITRMKKKESTNVRQ